MTSRLQYILLFGIHFIVLTALLYLVFQDNKIYFLISELGLLILLAIAYRVYLNIFKPLEFIKQGSEALLDEDFNVRFAMKGSPDMDVLIQVYNQMLDKIRHERIYQQEQHFFLDSLLEILPVGIVILDYDDNIAQYNHHGSRILSLKTEDIGKAFSLHPHALSQELVHISNDETTIIKLGSIDYFRCTSKQFIHRGFPRKYFVIEEISSEILAAEKQAYGKVIRMMAHEVNNSTGAINSILHSLLSDDDINPEELRTYLPIVINRNENLGQFMKNFAAVIRLPQPTRKRFDLVPTIQNIATLYSRIMQEHRITLKLDLPDTYIIRADPEQIEQVLVNVLKNSIEAITEKGIIRITLQNDTLSIIDNGCGISEEVQAQLFTPFFSTKTTGQGVGLTLIKQILHQHHYSFHLYSKEGETWFDIKVGEEVG